MPKAPRILLHWNLLQTNCWLKTVQRLNIFQKQKQGVHHLLQSYLNFLLWKQFCMASNFVTVSKIDAIQWEDVTLELRDFIRIYISEGNEIITELPTSEVPVDNTFTVKKEVFTELQCSLQLRRKWRLLKLLNIYSPCCGRWWRKYYFQEFYRWCCYCSTSRGLQWLSFFYYYVKAGIETLLKRMIPEVTEVVAETM